MRNKEMNSNNQITPNNKSEKSNQTFKIIIKPDEKKKPVIKKKDPSIGNTGSVQSSLVSTYNHLTNSNPFNFNNFSIILISTVLDNNIFLSGFIEFQFATIQCLLQDIDSIKLFEFSRIVSRKE